MARCNKSVLVLLLVVLSGSGCGDERTAPGDGTVYAELPSVPSELVATDGTFADEVALSWQRSERAVSYNVYKAIDTPSAETRLVARDVQETSFRDTTVTAGRHYYYQVSAVNTQGESERSNMDSGFAGDRAPEPPAAPENVVASDGGWHVVDVGWDPVATALTYSVYRCRTPVGSYTRVASELTETSFVDAGVELGAKYYYTVSGTNAQGEGPHSEWDGGFAVQAPPAAPAVLSASDGDYARMVLLTWEAVEDATSYTLYRADSSGGDYEELVGGILGTSYEDRDIVVEAHYFYRVSAHSDVGEGTLSPEEEGFAASDGANPPPTPASVAATEDTPEYVAITWEPATGAASYVVYRSTQESSGFVELAAGLAATEYDDLSVNAEQYYFYRVAAANADGESLPSGSVRGYALIGPPATPQNLVASDGEYYDRVSLRWDSADRAASYTVYRAAAGDGSFAVLASDLTDAAYDDTEVVLGTSYLYRVSAVNTTSESQGFAADEGYAELGVPSGLVAAKGDTNCSISLVWNAVDGAESYRVYRKITALGSWNLAAEGLPDTSYLLDVACISNDFFRISAVRGSHEGPQSDEVERWTVF